MAPRRVVALALVGVLALAGCAGLFGGDSAGTTTPPTADAPTGATVTTPSTETGYPPGLSESGVDNAFELGRAHRALLENRSYTKLVNDTTRYANGSLRYRTRIRARSVPTDGDPRLHVVQTFAGPAQDRLSAYPDAERIETYAAERTGLHIVRPNGSNTELVSRWSPTLRVLEVALEAFEVRLAPPTPCGNLTCYRLRSTNLTAPERLSESFVRRDGWTVTGASLVAVVDERGLVRQYRLEYVVETPARTYNAVRTVRITAVGETEVERPDWYGTPTG